MQNCKSVALNLALALVLVTGCGKQADPETESKLANPEKKMPKDANSYFEDKLVGTWIIGEPGKGREELAAYIFNEKNEGSVLAKGKRYEFSYRVKDGQIVLSFKENNEKQSLKFNLDTERNLLSIDLGEVSGVLFHRKPD